MFRILTLLLLITICSGCENAATDKPDENNVAVPESAPVVADQNPAEPVPAQPQGFSQLEWKLVDKNKALAENPKLIEVENKTNASDPWSAAAQSYFTMGSKVHLLNFKHSIDLHKAEHDKFPTFDEFNSMLKSANVDLKGLYPWQVYAYDDKTGTLAILEDREEKQRKHEEAGLPMKD